MKTLHWFNPENDLALAANLSSYTPPKGALGLRRAGALLPSLWAEEGDKILVTDPCNRQDPLITSTAPAGFNPAPWGWSSYAASVLKRKGVESPMLPEDEKLSWVRKLSHRATAAQVLAHMGYDPGLIPVTAPNAAEAARALEKFGGRGVVKLPWSCSGRGVVTFDSTSSSSNLATLENMVRRQGSVTVEPLYDRIRDFAMLFRLDRGEATFEGLSLFVTDSSGHYGGNIIAPQHRLHEMLGVDLDALKRKLGAALVTALEGYDGWAGVDMLTYRTMHGTTAVAPCIEINLRMTMGIAALLAERRGKLPWDEALLRVAMPGETPGADSIALSATLPDLEKPLAAPCMVVQKRRSMV